MDTANWSNSMIPGPVDTVLILYIKTTKYIGLKKEL